MANMGEKSALALVAVWTVTLVPVSALASKPQTPGEDLKTVTAADITMTICSSTLTPSGWVDIQWWNSSSCGNTFDPNIKQIQQVSTLPVGTTLNACASTYPPSGWTQVGASFYSSSCRYSSVPSFSPNAWTLKRVY